MEVVEAEVEMTSLLGPGAAEAVVVVDGYRSG